MNDLFYECKENYLANYADDASHYLCASDIPTVISELQKFLIALAKNTIIITIITSKPIQINVTYYLVLKTLKLYVLMEYK